MLHNNTALCIQYHCNHAGVSAASRRALTTSAFSSAQSRKWPSTSQTHHNCPITELYSSHVTQTDQSAAVLCVIPTVFWWRNFCLSGLGVFSQPNMLRQEWSALIGRLVSRGQNAVLWLVGLLPVGTLALNCGCGILGCFLCLYSTPECVLLL